MKCSYFQAAVVSILLYGCTTWKLTKRLEKKLGRLAASNLEQVLEANTPQKTLIIRPTYLPSRKNYQSLYEPDMQGHCWRSRDELISDVQPMDPPTYGREKSRTTSSNITYSSSVKIRDVALKDLPEAMND